MTWAASRDGSPLLWVYLGLGLVVTAWRVRGEYVRRPATLSYWDEGTGFALNVRHVRTGELLLQSETASIAHADLCGARLAGANLTGVDLHGAKLEGADLTGANLRSARLCSANLQGAVLRGAELRASDLDSANLHGADLRHARFGNATMTRASFRDADLRGASFAAFSLDPTLWDNPLTTADFTGARWNSATRWPKRFDPAKAGAIYEEGGEADLPIPHDGDVVSEARLPIPADGHQRIEEPTHEAVRVGGRG
ncbi:MAG: pentapeptide repeat-containing protein [Actinomycetota bacterium]